MSRDETSVRASFKDRALDLVDELFELRARDRPLLARLDEAGQDAVARIRFAAGRPS
jgi:hypothetical protein